MTPNPGLIIGLLLLGAYTSYTDARKGKIPNIAVALASVYFFTAHIIMGNALAYALSFTVLLLMGVILWKLEYWKPGDAKLAAALSLGLPVPFIGGLWAITYALSLALFAYGTYLLWNSLRRPRTLARELSPRELLFIFASLLLLRAAFLTLIDDTRLTLLLMAASAAGVYLGARYLLPHIPAVFIISYGGAAAIISRHELSKTHVLIPLIGITLALWTLVIVRRLHLNSKTETRYNANMPFAPFLFAGALATLLIHG